MASPVSALHISASALKHNVNTFRSILPRRIKIAGVVKSNAYGHGLKPVVECLMGTCDAFQVNDADELSQVRAVDQDVAVLVLGHVAPSEIEDALKLGGQLAVYDRDQLKRVNAAAQKLKTTASIHVKVDALLGRLGILEDDVEPFLDELAKCGHVKVEGLYTHFADCKDPSDRHRTKRQLSYFRRVADRFVERGYRPSMRHVSATAGTLLESSGFDDSDLVRLGIGIYGMWPSPQIRRAFESSSFQLQSAVRWVTRVAQVKTVPADWPIGYGATYTTARPTRIAVIPQGYGNGYDRGLSNRAVVLISGQPCPIVGRVAMNMFVADVSHLQQVATGDEVVLLGSQGNQRVTAERLAELLDTIPYEITTRISALLPRVVMD